ncbi:MAG: hypothetical protein LBR52_03335 [Prevotellaceae bacterium]|nr:hypothetical protein [Prevotellaceae bacterium]
MNVQQSNYAVNTITLSGYFDSYNTTTRKWQHLEQKYEPLKNISISNNSQKRLYAPQLFFNNRNYYDEQKMLSSILASSNSLQDSLLTIQTFVKERIIHLSHANAKEVYDDSYKALFVYGYALYTAHVYSIGDILLALGISSEEIINEHHHIIQAVIDKKKVIIDADEQVFYKDLSNDTAIGLNEVFVDKFLIKRTKHLSRSEYPGRETSLVYQNPRIVPFTKRKYHSFDFILKPGEKVIFNYAEPTLFHQINYENASVSLNEVKALISNSLYSYNQNFLNVDLTEVLYKAQNITAGQNNSHPNLHPDNTDVAEFIVKFDLPFPVLDINVKMNLQQATPADSILMYYSTDCINWKRFYQSQQTGNFVDSINLYNEVAPLEKDALYGYYLKFQFHPKDSSWACGMDSLEVNTTFQCSRFFLPKLQLGENTVEYTDANGNDSTRNVEVTIEWQENWENRPPNKVTNPVFPLHRAEVDSLYFAFVWEPAEDADGDEITDYEFMLSEDDRMLYPYSPNFNLYISAFGEDSIRPHFKVKETGWLNDGQTYYWRVRAKDARGVWGEWSDTWSFTPHGVMRPVETNAEIIGQTIRLSWAQNPTGKKPDFYKIYASDEMNGFTPGESSFFTVTDTTEFFIPFKENIAPLSFYRISACDTLGQESLISSAIALPYPYIYAVYDSVRTDSAFRLNLISNERFYPYIHYDYNEDWYIPKITVLEKPEWLIQQSQNVLYTNDPMSAKRLLYLDSLQSSVLVLLEDDWGNWREQRLFLHTTATNNKPALMLSDSILSEDNSFLAYITSTDGDVAFGDINSYTLLEKPEWLNCDIKGDTIRLTANGKDFESSLLRILAVDTKNDSTTVEYLLSFEPYEQTPTFVIETSYQIYQASKELYYIKIKGGGNEFSYNLYAVDGTILHSSSTYNLMGGIYYFPVNMSKYPDGIYIFEGVENNRKRSSTKFIKK